MSYNFNSECAVFPDLGAFFTYSEHVRKMSITFSKQLWSQKLRQQPPNFLHDFLLYPLTFLMNQQGKLSPVIKTFLECPMIVSLLPFDSFRSKEHKTYLQYLLEMRWSRFREQKLEPNKFFKMFFLSNFWHLSICQKLSWPVRFSSLSCKRDLKSKSKRDTWD